MYKRGQSPSIHHSHATVVSSMEAGTWIMAIAPSMWLPDQGPGHGHIETRVMSVTSKLK